MKKHLVIIILLFVSCAKVYKYECDVTATYFNGETEKIHIILPVEIYSDGSGDTEPLYLYNGCLKAHQDVIRCGVRGFTIRKESFTRDGKKIEVKK